MNWGGLLVVGGLAGLAYHVSPWALLALLMLAAIALFRRR